MALAKSIATLFNLCRRAFVPAGFRSIFRSRSSPLHKLLTALRGGASEKWHGLTLWLSIGRRGERYVARILREDFYTILETNWRGLRGELDIIAQRGNTLLIVEVKTRRGETAGYFPPLEAIDEQKQQKILSLARQYLRKEYKILRRRRIRWIQFEWAAVVYYRRAKLFSALKIYQRVRGEKKRFDMMGLSKDFC